MIIAVWVPLLLPLLAVPVARYLAEALPPRAAALTLAGSAVLLAAASTAALALISTAGVLRLPAVAALGHLSLPWLRRMTPDAVPLAVPAGAALAAVAGLLLRCVRRHRGDLARARAQVAAAQAGPGGLAVLPDGRADAYALPGRPGRIVVTSGMLQALSVEERAALFAHERAHLAGRHHLFLAAAEYAAAAHPALRWLRGPLSYHVERWADEAAAAAVGDRALTARAVGRAALAAGPSARRGAGLAAAHTGPIPRRVAALLAPSPAPAPSRRHTAVAALLAACLCASTAATLEATRDLHQVVETAQAEPGH